MKVVSLFLVADANHPIISLMYPSPLMSNNTRALPRELLPAVRFPVQAEMVGEREAAIRLGPLRCPGRVPEDGCAQPPLEIHRHQQEL